MSRTITITLEPVGVSEIQRVTLSRTQDGIGAIAVYHILDDAGDVYSTNKHLFVPMTPAQKSALTAFVTDTVIPAINEHEQLNEDPPE